MSLKEQKGEGDIGPKDENGEWTEEKRVGTRPVCRLIAGDSSFCPLIVVVVVVVAVAVAVAVAVVVAVTVVVVVVVVTVVVDRFLLAFNSPPFTSFPKLNMQKNTWYPKTRLILCIPMIRGD